MSALNRRDALKMTAAGLGAWAVAPTTYGAEPTPRPFGPEFPNLESFTTGEWWKKGGDTL